MRELDESTVSAVLGTYPEGVERGTGSQQDILTADEKRIVFRDVR